MTNFQKIIDKISDAFSILDFSYIISGGFTFLLILFDLFKHNESFMLGNMTITIICGIFLSYICGLLSWLLGKNIRRLFHWITRNSIEKDFKDIYERTITSINDTSNNRFSHINNNSLAYEYMWICLSKTAEADQRMNYIHRFWVMQAVYEGLIFSFVVAFCVLIDVWTMHQETFLDLPHLILILIGILIAGLFCMLEARRCARTQISEVIFAYYIYVLKEI